MPNGTPASATGATPTVSYTTAGTKTVTLTVTDNGGLTNTISQSFSVTAAPPVDNPPVANFTWSCLGLTCNLDASSSTDDGTIVSYAWDLGRFPNPTGSGMLLSATYPHTGPRTVTLTVTDNAGKTGSITKVITVGGPPVDNPSRGSVQLELHQPELHAEWQRLNGRWTDSAIQLVHAERHARNRDRCNRGCCLRNGRNEERDPNGD